ncbi:DUF2332 domain-containing protein [Erythrobacter sp. WH158]|uniref:DUF2332 domain-containing protein n=2 Tax=Erythrobacter crassostreae TaxID=2828328 RepID=A0A9X1F399_9SPHN|nr:DUF2332 domain-containing protein [Erythrobacter crassostrea]
MAIEEFNEALDWQATHADENNAPCTARIVRALAKVRDSDTATGRRIANWEGLTLKDAMPLRMAGGLHHLLLSGQDDRLARVYSGQITDQGLIDALVCELVETYDTQLLPWLDGPPQTNEAGRAASIMGGLLWVAQRAIPKLELFELGASAGVLTMLERYRFHLGETAVGPLGSPMQIEPAWRGEGAPPAPPENFQILSVRGCDVGPIDLADPDSALRLKSYVWPDAPGRMARIDAAIALASAKPPELVKQDAGEFVTAMLAEPQTEGVTRVMFHSIMWQYMPASTQEAITAEFEAAGAEATEERPLAWVSLETDPATFRHELKVRLWNGSAEDGTTHLLSHAHPHGAWVEWLDG